MRHDAQELKQSLTIDNIRTLLSELGAEHIPDNLTNSGALETNTICHNTSGGSHKLSYDDSRKSFICYTQCSDTFDVYELVKRVYEQRNITLHFKNIVDYVAQKTGNSFGFGAELSSNLQVSEELEWMQKFTRHKVELPEPKYHSKRILDVFSNYYHPSWLSDNISIDAMKKFDIKFYNKDNRIVIPHYHPANGELIGIRGRALNSWEVETYKYLPLTVQGIMYNFPSHGQLYGAWQNRDVIKRLKKIIIFESEKSVLQCDTYFPDNNFSVAIMGRNISQYQIDFILSMGVEEVQIAMDREFKEQESAEQGRDIEFLLRLGRRFSPFVRTYVLFDTTDLIDYKNSPSDHGRETLISMMKGKSEILNKE